MRCKMERSHISYGQIIYTYISYKTTRKKTRKNSKQRCPPIQPDVVLIMNSRFPHSFVVFYHIKLNAVLKLSMGLKDPVCWKIPEMSRICELLFNKTKVFRKLHLFLHSSLDKKVVLYITARFNKTTSHFVSYLLQNQLYSYINCWILRLNYLLQFFRVQILLM